MALKDLWGRVSGRDAPAPTPATAMPVPETDVFVPDLDPDLLADIPAELLAELRRDAPELLVPEARASDPVPGPPPVEEPPQPIPVPPDEDEPPVGEPPPPDLPDTPPAEEPGSPAPIQDPPAHAAGVAVSGAGAAPVPLRLSPDLPQSAAAFAPAGQNFGNTGAGPMSGPVSLGPTLAEAGPAPRVNFLGRLREGLRRSTQRLGGGLSGLFIKRKLDDAALEELEDTLISADLGVGASRRIVASFRRTRFGREVGDEEVRAALAEEIAAILAPVARPLDPRAGGSPRVVLMVGVNGTGKTTTIAKLAELWRGEGLKVMLAAGDTFRAAAVEQLQVWGDRTGCPVVVPAKPGADAAGLAHEALDRARAEGMDVLLVDTAGRLHNKTGLMEELRKVVRVLRKREPAAPHDVVLVLDATTGQNAIQQVKVFREMVDVSGLVVTKLDGSAKGGVVVALAEEFGLPMHAVGVGERATDLRPFEARDYARSLVGLE